MEVLVPDNWCMSGEWVESDPNIRQLLNQMTYDEYIYVSLNRHKYDILVQNIIAEYDIQHHKKLKLTIRDLGDAEFRQLEIDRRNKLLKHVDDAWDQYKKKENIQREMGYVDVLCDEMYTKLLNARGKLQNELNKLPTKLTGAYVTPSRRNTSQLPEKTSIINARNELEVVEKNFEKLKNEIIQLDHSWNDRSKYDFAIKTGLF